MTRMACGPDRATGYQFSEYLIDSKQGNTRIVTVLYCIEDTKLRCCWYGESGSPVYLSLNYTAE